MDKKLRIIILLINFHNLPLNQKEILNYILNNQEIDLIQIIEIPEKKRNLFTFKIINKIFLKYLIYFEKNFLKKTKKYNHELKIFNKNFDKIDVKKIYPIRKKYSDRFKNSDLEKIKNLKPDLIFNFTDRLIKGEILSISKLGVLGFHLSDTDFQRNGLGGFYEIIEQQEYSGITIQKYNNLVDGGLVAHKKKFKTLKFFTINHNNLLNETLGVFKETMQLALKNKIVFKNPAKYKKKLYEHPPSLKNLIKYFYLSYIK